MTDRNNQESFLNLVTQELRKHCEHAWSTGDYETAVFNALKVLEGHIADAVAEKGLVGTQLIDAALAPKTGKLKIKEHSAEQEGFHQTVRGLFLLLRNPSAHRFVEYTPKEAAAIISFTSFLLESLNRVIASQDPFLDFKQGFSHYVLADSDGDGKQEKIVVVKKEPFPSTKSELHILKQSPVGLQRYQLLDDFLEFGVYTIKVKDINKDGLPELLISTPVGAHAESLYVFRWNGTGYQQIGDFWSDAPSIQVTDLDGDGMCEVQTMCRNYDKNPLSNSFVKVFHWDGTQYVLCEEYETTR